MPSAETDAIVKKVSHVRNVFDEYGDLKEPAVHIYNAAEKEEREIELKRIDDQLNAPAWVNERLSSERRGDMLNRAKDLRKQLAKYAPPDKLSGEEKDALYALAKKCEDIFVPALLPHEVMWRNPAGAADRHLRGERDTKDAILTWKNIQVMLDPQNRDADLRNIERFRPSLANPHGAATFMANARLPGNFAMTAAAKENFDTTFPNSPTIDTPMKQMERRDTEMEELKRKNLELQAALDAKTSRSETIRKERKERMAKARAARKSKMETPRPEV